MDEPPLLAHLPADPDPDALLEGFVAYVADQGIDLYPAQEEAILELLGGSNVILNTPTGSGKSLVAAAAHFAAFARGRRSMYTAPIKALVNEKFFALCRDFGRDNVGMITGDAAVNAEAPIICATAEILSNRALRDGAATDIDVAIMDEFHYYADPQRGAAWQIPLLELARTQFLLLSATLGPTSRFENELVERTGRPTVVVRSRTRPVPLDFEYRSTPVHESIQQLLDSDRAPVYVVHFTQRDATAQAQALTSLGIADKDHRVAVRDAVGDFRFDTPFGKDLRRYVEQGIGVHHAGLLPKYRLLVEKLAQLGLLRVVCGTDTLGVGVNVPIRTVLFTQLCKYDGSGTRLLSVREFQQIAGRAGRKGFDDEGFVWVQAPAHWIENQRAEEKAAAGNKKRKAVKRRPPERGYAHWDEASFQRLVGGDPEPLVSSFAVSHQMLLNLLDRPGDGCGAVRRLLVDNHETRRRQRAHIRRAIGMYRSLVDAGVVETLAEPDARDRLVRVTIDLQDDFALTQPLSLFAVEAIGALDPAAPTHSLDVLSVVESVLENPAPVIAAQLDRIKGELIARLKTEGVEYEDRMAELAEVEHPKPLGDLLYEHFDRFRVVHPWVGGDNVRPKSVARDLYERAMTFREYIDHYGLKRTEGVVLRYLSDAYRGLVQNVPEVHKTDEVYDLTEWLGETVRQVDSSLVDEWERLLDPTPLVEVDVTALAPPDVTTNERAFLVMVRNEAFRWVQLLARRDWAGLADASDGTLDAEDLEAGFAAYWDDHGAVLTDGVARSPANLVVDRRHDGWGLRQVISDPEQWHDWSLTGDVDLAASRVEGRAVLRLSGLSRT